jgi:hypothetical protein
MSAEYRNRIVSILTNLANELAKHKYRNESTAIRGIVGNVQSWKDDAEWNTQNSLSIPDADQALRKIPDIFIATMNEANNRELRAKNEKVPEPGKPEQELDTSKIEQALSDQINNLFK